MNWKHTFAGLLVALMVPAVALGQPAEQAPAVEAGSRTSWLEDGERLTYTVRWGFLKAGEAELLFVPAGPQAVPGATGMAGDDILMVDDEERRALGEQRKPYTVVARAWTTGTTGALFSLRDRVRVAGSDNGFGRFLTEAYELRLNENDYRAHKTVHYLRSTNVALYQNHRAGHDPVSYTIPPKTRDMLSALYHIRALSEDAETGKVFTLPVFDLNSLYDMKVYIGVREKLKTAMGEVSTLHVQPVLIDRQTGEKDESWHLWVTDDGRYIPVRIKVKLSFGAFTAELKHVGGLADDASAPAELPVAGPFVID